MRKNLNSLLLIFFVIMLSACNSKQNSKEQTISEVKKELVPTSHNSCSSRIQRFWNATN